MSLSTNEEEAQNSVTSSNRVRIAVPAPLVGALLLCLFWENATRIFDIPSYVLPAPSDIFNAVLASDNQRLLFYATIQTGSAAALGFIIAAVVGILLGTLLASVRILRRGVYPLANLLQMVPIIAIAPLLNIWFGYGIVGVAASATIVSIFPVIANTVDGLRSIDPHLIELFNVYGANSKQRWRLLEIPAALPQIFTGLRVAAGLAVIGAVVGELVSGVLTDPPIGAVIASNLRTSKLEIVFAAIACSAIVGFSLFGLVSWCGQRFMGRWNSSQQREVLDDKLTPDSERKERYLIIFITTISLVLTIIAFLPKTTQSRSKEILSSHRDRTELTSVSLQLNWLPEPEFGGIYEAKRLGFDREEGIDLQIIAGGPGTPSGQLVAQKKIEFAVVDSTQIISMRAKGAGLIGIYASFNKDPRGIITHTKNAPSSLETLWHSNRMMAVEPGSIFMKWLSHKYGESQLTWVSTTGGLSQFKLDPLLAQSVFVFSEPVILKLQGIETRLFPISDSGYNPYAVVVATHEDLNTQNPRLINAMNKVLRRGWSSYLKNSVPTNRLLSKLNTSMSFEAMELALRFAKPFIIGDSEHLGEMKLNRWRKLKTQLSTLGLLDAAHEVKASDCFWQP